MCQICSQICSFNAYVYLEVLHSLNTNMSQASVLISYGNLFYKLTYNNARYDFLVKIPLLFYSYNVYHTTIINVVRFKSLAIFVNKGDGLQMIITE